MEKDSLIITSLGCQGWDSINNACCDMCWCRSFSPIRKSLFFPQLWYISDDGHHGTRLLRLLRLPGASVAKHFILCHRGCGKIIKNIFFLTSHFRGNCSSKFNRKIVFYWKECLSFCFCSFISHASLIFIKAYLLTWMSKTQPARGGLWGW